MFEQARAEYICVYVNVKSRKKDFWSWKKVKIRVQNMISASRLRQTWSSGSRGSKYCLSCVCVEFVETNIWIETSSCREMTRAPDDRLETLKDSPAPPQHTYAYTHTHTHKPSIPFQNIWLHIISQLFEAIGAQMALCVCCIWITHCKSSAGLFSPSVRPLAAFNFSL